MGAAANRLISLGVLTLLVGACGTGADPPAPSTNPSVPPVTTGGAPTSSAPFVATEFQIDADLSVRQVAEGVYIIRHSLPWAANSLLVEMPDGELVLVDTPYTPEATEEVLAWAEDRLGPRPVTAISTGFHVDNLGGNAYLLAAGIPVYGSEETAALLVERGEATRALLLGWLQAPADARYREAQAAVPYLPPDHLFPLDEGLALSFGDETVQVWFPGPTHAPDNVVVYFPNRRLLFGGCMILAGDEVGNTADADLAAWPESVARLAAFDADMVVPGHGDRLDPGLIAHTIAVLTEHT